MNAPHSASLPSSRAHAPATSSAAPAAVSGPGLRCASRRPIGARLGVRLGASVGLLSLVVLAVTAAACGGRVDAVEDGGTHATVTSDAGGGGSNPGHEIDGGTSGGGFAIEGSYDVVFTQASATYPGGSGVPSAPSPSAGMNGRLDILSERGNGDPVYSAFLTPRWGEPAAFDVTVHDRELVLDNPVDQGATFGGTSNGFYVTDTWSHLVVDRASNGTLTGVVHATGSEQMLEGDQVWDGDLAGVAKLGTDVTQPELRSKPLSVDGPADKLLPWDPLDLQIAEPVSPSDVTKTTDVVLDDHSLSVAWKEGAGSTGLGVVRLRGTLTSWTGAVGFGSIQHLGGVTDPTGNASAPLNQPLSWLGLPGALAAHHFGGDLVATVEPWGNVAALDGAPCEGSGCMRVGPFTHQACSGTRLGFAGLLAPTASSSNLKVHVRYRVLAEPTTGGSGAPSIFEPPLVVQTAIPGGIAQETPLAHQSGDYSELASPIDGLSWGTPWTTVDIAAPQGSSFGSLVGFVVRGGSGTSCGGIPLPTSQVEVLVDSVSLSE